MSHGGIIIRPMKVSDVPVVMAIEQAVFSDPWPESAFHELLASHLAINLVAGAVSLSQMAGYLCAQLVAGELQIHNLAVREGFQRQGVGARLLVAAETEGRRRGAREAILDVRADNTAALALYARFGYRRIGLRRRYYRRPVCDALILFKPLPPPADIPPAEETTHGMVP